jgi:hypothetical protein
MTDSIGLILLFRLCFVLGRKSLNLPQFIHFSTSYSLLMSQIWEMQEHFTPPVENAQEEREQQRRRQRDDETSFLDQIPKYDSRQEHDRKISIGDARVKLSELDKIDWLESCDLANFEIVERSLVRKTGNIAVAKYLHCRACLKGSDYSVFAVRENLRIAQAHNIAAHKDLVSKDSEKRPFRFAKGNTFSPWRSQPRVNGKFVKSQLQAAIDALPRS